MVSPSSLASFLSQLTTPVETLHNYKYPVQRQDNVDPKTAIWVSRKIGLYSKYCPANETTTWILIQPAKGCFMDRVETVLQKLGPVDKRHDLEVRLIFLKAAGQGWTPYINDLEKEFRGLDEKVFLWRPDIKNLVADDHHGSNLEMPDTQRIQKFKVKLHELEHTLDINAANVESIRRGLFNFRSEGGDQYVSAEQRARYDRELNELNIEISQHKTRVKHLIRCTEGLFSLVCTIVRHPKLWRMARCQR
jgi:hypothetical protein